MIPLKAACEEVFTILILPQCLNPRIAQQAHKQPRATAKIHEQGGMCAVRVCIARMRALRCGARICGIRIGARIWVRIYPRPPPQLRS